MRNNIIVAVVLFMAVFSGCLILSGIINSSDGDDFVAELQEITQLGEQEPEEKASELVQNSNFIPYKFSSRLF